MKPPQTNMTRFTDQHTASDIATDPLPEPESKNDELTIPTQKEDKHIPVPEHAEPEPVKMGFWKRFFLPNG